MSLPSNRRRRSIVALMTGKTTARQRTAPYNFWVGKVWCVFSFTVFRLMFQKWRMKLMKPLIIQVTQFVWHQDYQYLNTHPSHLRTWWWTQHSFQLRNPRIQAVVALDGWQRDEGRSRNQIVQTIPKSVPIPIRHEGWCVCVSVCVHVSAFEHKDTLPCAAYVT